MKILSAALVLLLALISCNSGGNGGVSISGAIQSPVLATDSSAEDFSTFQIVIEQLQGIRADSSLTGNMLIQPVRFNLLAHDGDYRLIGNLSFTPGVVGVQATISSQVDAADEQGNPVAVLVTNTTAQDQFTMPMTSAKTVAIEFSLDEEALEDIGPNSVAYTPSIHLIETENFWLISNATGSVISKDEADHQFQVEVRNSHGDDSYGVMTVHVEGATQLSAPDGINYSSEAEFFTAISQGTRVTIDGSLQTDRSIVASSVMVEDVNVVAKIRGRVHSIDSGNQLLDLHITAIEKGFNTVFPVLLGLPNPFHIQISFASSTVFLMGDGGGAVTTSELAVGQAITVGFDSFGTPEPFDSQRIVIHGSEVWLKARIESTSGLPNSMQVELNPFHPLVLNNTLNQHITVDMSDSNLILTLGLPWTFALSKTDLIANQKIIIRGAIAANPPDTVIAHRVRVRPGFVNAVVTSENPLGHSLVAAYLIIWIPFGGSTDNPAMVHVHDPAVLIGRLGGVLTPGQFFNQLENGSIIHVRGIGKPDGSIVAYKIRIF